MYITRVIINNFRIYYGENNLILPYDSKKNVFLVSGNNGFGQIGNGFIECHHKIPLSKYVKNNVTKLEDLALVCSNCHRMLHKEISELSFEDFKNKYK